MLGSALIEFDFMLFERIQWSCFIRILFLSFKTKMWKANFFSLILLIFTYLTLKEKNPCVLGIAKVLMGKVPTEKYLIRRNKIGSAFLRGCSSFLGAVSLRHHQGLPDSLTLCFSSGWDNILASLCSFSNPPSILSLVGLSGALTQYSHDSLNHLLELCFWLCS